LYSTTYVASDNSEKASRCAWNFVCRALEKRR